ncbi:MULTISPECIES: UDP-N-acetylmuramoyl-tripeptide--D-alanyl-D-alanine ligase [unclassified Bacillus (in: firmicutes)]|uniref:UDP-N-acetylmuramoyl-tripeptide--D-alanyl-D- alanine ligase n=1 Tax=unclassified Bacillus (in: firmicutes) TaxID=185979 RepID=UPI0008E27FAF|nr:MULTISPECIES: UDP-N-acetylmuramoyl-tripeptide--D-alanyl-D-alanine ligase [unclassified Bacillus (in: firmicutes)]SFB24261.1 UDP-N-acetylmuramoyl-tripeptide--D-alanyl-D-alanine ligase [Bacillus sp. UNCCL13]SFQ91369.1 UDP-N-acetylmuramoyl-tripeptide--D-alanyl-D-alanine ligase [Bacillus sp. cl95]
MFNRSVQQINEMITLLNDVTSFNEVMVHGVTIDSRKIEKGNLFVPFKGEKVDGHQYVEDAIKNGAAAAFWQEDVPNPPMHLPILIVKDCLIALQELAKSYRQQLSVKVIGITGSNGKTTTKDMMANLLSIQFKVKKTEGNYNNHIGLPLTVLQLEEDTEMAVLEMGMSGKGEIEFLTKLAQPDVTIITNIGESHLLDLGSRDGIAEAKLEIAEGLSDGGLLVYNGDEPLLTERVNKFGERIRLQAFGRNENNYVYPIDIEQSDSGNHFNINLSEVRFFLPVLGTHNILNALAAMLVAKDLGIPFEKMNEGLSSLKLTQMRMELVEGANGEKIINDAYNASPTSMKAAIDLVSNLPGYKKKILVLGDMLELGPLEEEFHMQIGESLEGEKIDLLFTYGQLGKLIAKGAEKSLGSGKVYVFEDKSALAKELTQKVDGQTLVLVKASRGMKLEDVVTSLQTKTVQ